MKSWRSPTPRRCRQDDYLVHDRAGNPGVRMWPQLILTTDNKRKDERVCSPRFQYDENTKCAALKLNSFSCFWENGGKCRRRAVPPAPGMYPGLDIAFRNAFINPPTTDQNVAYNLSVTGTSSPAFFFTVINICGWKWTSSPPQYYNIFKDKSTSRFGQNMVFSNVVAFREKFYALSLQGSVVVIEPNESCIKITGVGKNRAVPSSMCRHFRENLFEYDDEILLVFLLSRKCMDVVDDVEVYSLDISKLVWVKRESLGRSTLCIEEGSDGGVVASEVAGIRPNCVYFTHGKDGSLNWALFEMETGQIWPVV